MVNSPPITTRERRPKRDPQGYFIESPFVPEGFLREEAQNAFDLLFAELNELEILREEDIPLLLMFADTVGTWREVTAHLQAIPGVDKYTVKGSRWQTMLDPLLRVQKQAAAAVQELSKLFALTPAMRANLNLDLMKPEGATERGEDGRPDFSEV